MGSSTFTSTSMLVLVLAVFAANARANTLGTVERQHTADLAASIPWEAVAQPRSLSAADDLGIQTLTVESHEVKSMPLRRLARVLQYDHRNRRTRRLVIDLDTAAVLETRAIESRHLPLNATEEAWVKAVLAADARVLDSVNRERDRLGQLPLQSLDELDSKMIVYEPRKATAACHVARCAAVSLFDRTQRVYALEPVVEFYSGQVTLGLDR